jgi:putative ABC transport system substrate-binding protein
MRRHRISRQSMARTVLYRLVAYLRVPTLRRRGRTPHLGRTQRSAVGAAHRLAFAIRTLATAIALLPTSVAAADRLAVVSSSDAAPYQQAIAGIQKLGYPVDALQLATDSETAITASLASIGRSGAVVTLGAAAAALVARIAPATPVVNCMVADGDESKVSPGSAVVPLEVPVEARVTWMKRFLPSVHNVGILFDPAHNERRAAEDAAALKRAGYAPILAPVTGPTALPIALTRLTNSVDVLHAIPDTTVFAREHSRALLLFSFRNQIPLAGPSEAWVRAGALYAIDWDYPDLGRYCGALALRLLAGGNAPLPAPARTRAVVNQRSAHQLHILWDADVMRAVDRVYE